MFKTGTCRGYVTFVTVAILLVKNGGPSGSAHPSVPDHSELASLASLASLAPTGPGRGRSVRRMTTASSGGAW